jgi:hypothetical protein
MKRSVAVAAATLATGGTAAGVAYMRVVRPWHLRWGATDAEIARAMPGDEVVANPTMLTTKAVTVDAEASAIWPWLAQIGYRRGGLYSYDFLDRLFGFLDAPSAQTVLPQFQDLRAGDAIPLGRGPSWPVSFVQPERHLVLTPVNDEKLAVTWAFGLYPVDALTTRLVTRVRARMPLGPLGYPPFLVYDAAAFVMTRKMLLNLKVRAERLGHQRVVAGEVPGIEVPRREAATRRDGSRREAPSRPVASTVEG